MARLTVMLKRIDKTFKTLVCPPNDYLVYNLPIRNAVKKAVVLVGSIFSVNNLKIISNHL